MWNEKEKEPILQYLLITFGISWGAEALVIVLERLALLPAVLEKVVAMMIIAIVVALAPGMAVYVLLKKQGNIGGLKDYLGRVFACRNRKSMMIGLLISFTIFAGYVVCTEQPLRPAYLAPLLLIMMIPGGGWEELGWRGFLQPALEKRFGYILGTLMMGVIWAIWHLPLWMVQNASQSEFKFWSFALYCIAFSFLLATTTKITKSVFSAILLHAWGNTMCGGVFTCGIMTDGPHTRTFAAFAIMIVLSTIGYYIADRIMDKPN